MVWLAAGLYFFAIYKLVLGLIGPVKNRLKTDKILFWRRRFANVIEPVEALGDRLPVSYRDYLAKQIALAGSPKNIDIDSLISLKVLLAFAGSGAGAIVLIFLGFSLVKSVLMLLMIAAICFFAADLWLNRMVRKRQKAIRLALPDTLDLLTISIEAGLGFDAALNKISKNTTTLLAEEFNRLLQEIQLGSSRREAFKNLLERTDVTELNSFVLAILQADVFGISIGKVLRVQSREMRIKRRQRAEEAAMKTPVKIVFPLILCIFPALGIVVLGPAAIQIYQTLFA